MRVLKDEEIERRKERDHRFALDRVNIAMQVLFHLPPEKKCSDLRMSAEKALVRALLEKW